MSDFHDELCALRWDVVGQRPLDRGGQPFGASRRNALERRAVSPALWGREKSQGERGNACSGTQGESRKAKQTGETGRPGEKGRRCGGA